MQLLIDLLILGLVARSSDKGIFASAHTLIEDKEAKGFKVAEIRCRPESLDRVAAFTGPGIYKVSAVITTFRGDSSLSILDVVEKVEAVNISGALPAPKVAPRAGAAAGNK